MFTIYAGDDLVYSSGYQEPRTSVLAPKCTIEIGKASTLSFILLPTHYLYESLFRLKTDIKAFLGETQIFNGRVLSLERDFFNQKTIICEGDLAFLLDSLQPPRVITTTPRQLFTSMVAEHNIQVNQNRQFTVGTIDIPLADSSEEFEDTSYRETKAAMETDLLGRFGGYFRTRVVNGTIYLDWLKLQNDICNQTLQFGANILDISEQVFASDIYTVLLPTGPAPKPEDTEPDNTPKFPMTIESVNDGSKLLENLDGIALYGRIVKTENIANAANPQDLKDKAEALFARTYKEQASSFKIKAVDLSLMGFDLDQFKVGHRTRILSPPHQIDVVLTVTRILYDIAKFEDSEVSLGIFSDELPSDLWNATLKGGSMSSSMGKVAGRGGGSGGGGALGKALKYYTELEDLAKIEAKKIQLIAEDLEIKTQTMSIIAGDVNDAHTKITANKEELDLRVVKKDAVVAAINASTEGVKVFGKNIDMLGTNGFRMTVGGHVDKDLNFLFDDSFSRITANKEELDLRVVKKDAVVAAINASTEGVKVFGKNIDMLSENGFRMTVGGHVDKDLNFLFNDSFSRITQTESDIDLRVVKKDAVVAAINASTEGVKVFGKNIDMLSENGFRMTVGGHVDKDLNFLFNDSFSRITQTENEIDLRVTKDGVITAINITPGTVKIDAAKLDVTGIINTGSIVVQSELSAERARITNLTTGLSTAGVLKANYLESTGNLKVGGTTTTDYLVVTGSGSIPIFEANTQLIAGDLSATTGTFGTLKYGTTDVSARFTGIDTRITNLSNDISTSLTNILIGPSMVYNSDRLDGKHSTDFLAATATAADSDKLGGKAAADYSLATHAHNGYALSNHSHTDYATTGHNHDTVYLKTTAKAADSDKLGGSSKSYFATSTHNHQATYSALGHGHKKADISDFPTRTSASFVTDVSRSFQQGVFVTGLSPYSTGYALTSVTLTVTKNTYYFYT